MKTSKEIAKSYCQKNNNCDKCIYFLVCNPEETPDKDNYQPYTAYDDIK